jgi:SAM-dependent methyltransferase
VTKPERPFLDFYEKHSVIPTQLEIADRSKFFKQRDFLFETLGIPVHFLKGSNILELGPGTGQKAAHLLSLNPSSYTAIDNNPASVSATKEIIAHSGFKGISRVINCDFLDFKEEVKYDLIIAELVIPTQLEPLMFLNKLMDHLVPGGLLIFTCMDPISLLSETLRNAIVKDLQLIDDDLRHSADRIVHFFSEDLDLLPGMNRRRSDWAVDQIIKPPVGPILDLPSGLESLSKVAIFHGSSPRFVEDYRWYKSPDISVENLSKIAIQNYWEKCHNFLDFRTTTDAVKPETNKLLFDLCNDVYSAVHEDKWHLNSRKTVETHCNEIKKLITSSMPSASASLGSFLLFWSTGDRKNLKEFRPWWGRGTQYVSVIKST